MQHSPSHIVLGIDPGLETTGFGIISMKKSDFEAKDFGVFHTDRETDLPNRLHQIYQDMEELLEMWHPDLLVIEKLVFVKNVTNGLLVAQARGVVLERAAARAIPVLEFLPSEIKAAVTGHGSAPKVQVGKMVQILLRLSEIPRPDDAADALAIALAGARKANISSEKIL